MPQVTMSDAARLAGVSRQHLYRLIESGKVSVSMRPGGQKAIDTSELLRVFGELRSEAKTASSDSPSVSPAVAALQVETAHKVELLEAEIRHLRDALRASEARIQAAESMQEKLLGVVASAQRLLEYRPASTSKKAPKTAAKKAPAKKPAAKKKPQKATGRTIRTARRG